MAEKWWNGLIPELDEVSDSNAIFRFDVEPWTYFILRFAGRPGGAEVARVRTTFLTRETSEGIAKALAGVVGVALQEAKRGPS